MWYIIDEQGNYAGYESWNRADLEPMLEYLPKGYDIDCYIPEPYCEQ